MFGLACRAENRPIWVTYQGDRTEYAYGVGGARVSMREHVGTPEETETVTFGEVEIRNFGQGAAEVIVTYPHPDVRLVNGEPSWLSYDQLGSVRVITDASGAWARERSYRPYGEASNYTNIATVANDAHGFIGERFDSGAGLCILPQRRGSSVRQM